MRIKAALAGEAVSILYYLIVTTALAMIGGAVLLRLVRMKFALLPLWPVIGGVAVLFGLAGMLGGALFGQWLAGEAYELTGLIGLAQSVARFAAVAALALVAGLLALLGAAIGEVLAMRYWLT